LQADQLLRERWCPIDAFAVPPNVHPHVAAIDPTQARKGLREHRKESLHHGMRAMRAHEWIREGDKAASRLAPKGHDGLFDLDVAMNARSDWHDLE
jgi:hypothetical protein